MAQQGAVLLGNGFVFTKRCNVMRFSRFFQSLVETKKTVKRGNTLQNFRPDVLRLEDRTIPSTVSSITSNFNGTAIPAGDDIWFSSVAKVSGVRSSPVTIDVTNQTISFTANGTNYSIAVPDTLLTLTPGQTTATTTFNNGWNTSAPAKFSGNVFLGGTEFQAVSGLPGGIKNVVWQASFSSDTAGISVNWQWAAAVYSSFAADNSAVNVKAVDDNHFAPYADSDHAGTPENYKAFVVGGATGGGGSNWSGSYSGTASVKPDVQAALASISGFVTTTDGVPIGGVTLILTLYDDMGNIVSTTTTTSDANTGFYSFSGLAAGAYSITEDTSTLPPLFIAKGSSPGTVNGSTDGTSLTEFLLSGIVLSGGNVGINYDFVAGPIVG